MMLAELESIQTNVGHMTLTNEQKEMIGAITKMTAAGFGVDLGTALFSSISEEENDSPNTAKEKLEYATHLSHPYDTDYFCSIKSGDFPDDSDNLVIATHGQLGFLGRAKQLERLTGKHADFRILHPEIFDDDEYKEAAIEYIGQVNILLDVREQELFINEHLRDKGMFSEETYVGDISAKTAAAAQKEQLRKIVIAKMADFIGKRWLPSLSIGIDKAEQIANIMLCGHDKISLSKIKTKPIVNWSDMMCKWCIKPANKPRITARTNQLVALCDVIDIWQLALEMSGARDIFDACDITMEYNVKIGQLISALGGFRKMSGVEQMVASLYSGVPVKDIIA